MVVLKCDLRDTTKKKLRDVMSWEGNHTHNALDDAIEQANLFKELLEINKR